MGVGGLPGGSAVEQRRCIPVPWGMHTPAHIWAPDLGCKTCSFPVSYLFGLLRQMASGARARGGPIAGHCGATHPPPDAIPSIMTALAFRTEALVLSIIRTTDLRVLFTV